MPLCLLFLGLKMHHSKLYLHALWKAPWVEDSETLGRDAVRDSAGFNLLFNAQRETKTTFW